VIRLPSPQRPRCTTAPAGTDPRPIEHRLTAAGCIITRTPGARPRLTISASDGQRIGSDVRDSLVWLHRIDRRQRRQPLTFSQACDVLDRILPAEMADALGCFAYDRARARLCVRLAEKHGFLDHMHDLRPQVYTIAELTDCLNRRFAKRNPAHDE
jgi:hypothetical protein